MSTTYYHTIDGSILGQTNAGVRTDYMTDALGSVTGTTVSGTVENTYRYMPFGTLLAKTGTSSDPTFLWIGSQGYRVTQRSYADYYVRLRHLAASSGTWTSLDKFWPAETGWGYANNNPTLNTDPSGALTATPVSAYGWYVACCGGYRSFISWTDVPQQQGYVIQQITFKNRVYTGCPPNATSQHEELTYYEAWPVSASGAVSPSFRGANDEWYWISNGLLWDGWTSNIGDISVQGIAIFVPGTPNGFLGNFEAWNVDAANGLLSTYEWSQWNYYYAFGVLTGEITWQTSNYTWNCCCGCKADNTFNPCYGNYTRTPMLSKSDILIVNDCPCRNATYCAEAQ